MATMFARDVHDRIAVRAYFDWLNGSQADAVTDWLTAERIELAEIAKRHPYRVDCRWDDQRTTTHFDSAKRSALKLAREWGDIAMMMCVLVTDTRTGVAL